MVKNKIIGKRFDGGKSPLGNTPKPLGDYPDLTLERVATQPEEQAEFLKVRTKLNREHMTMAQRDALGDRGASGASKTDDELIESLMEAGLINRDVDLSRPGMKEAIKLQAKSVLTDLGNPHNMDRAIDQRLANFNRHVGLPDDAPLQAGTRAVARSMLQNPDYEFPEAKERAALHRELQTWASRELKIEKVQSSWFHHMVEYDQENFGTLVAADLGEPQLFVVENDWGALGIPEEGDWRLPFKLTVWEMQLSGVRVLTIVESDTDGSNPMVFQIYGKNKTWVIDDFRYEQIGNEMKAVKNGRDRSNSRQFPAVMHKVWNTIRACCVMVDAQVAKHETVSPSKGLVESRARSGKPKPKPYLIVKLLRHRPTSGNIRVAQGPQGARAPQRGHWRKGTWVHYDDQDSGQVQYANDGGFVVSKTWRRWHFAGDPNNLVHKEYRV